MNSRSIRKRLRQQHHEIFQQLQRNRYLQYLENILQDEIELQLPIITTTDHSNNIKGNSSTYNNSIKQQPHHTLLPSTLKQIFTQQLHNTNKQLLIQRQKLNRVNQQQVYSEYADTAINKILQMNEKINLIKQFFLYSKYLKVMTRELESDIGKYFQYEKRQSTICEHVHGYLSNKIISDIIFRQYLKTYNVNIFTSDLIAHYFELNRKGLLVNNNNNRNSNNENQHLVFQPERIPQLCLLQKKNIVFKQLYDINEKYSLLLGDMRYSYVNDFVQIMGKLQGQEGQSCRQKGQQEQQRHHRNEDRHSQVMNIDKKSSHNKKSDIFQDYNSLINQKLQNLNYLINKMSLLGTNLNQSLQNPHVPLIVNQYHQNFSKMTKYMRVKNRISLDNINKNINKDLNLNENEKSQHQHYKKFLIQIFDSNNNSLNTNNNNRLKQQKQSLAAFFQENLIVNDSQQLQQNNQMYQENQPHKFEFLQNKIIKTETLLVLNKIFSTFNIFSYIYQQLNPGSVKQTQYAFKSPLKKHIETDFKGQQFIKIKSTQQTNTNIGLSLKKISLKNHYHSPRNKSHYNVFIETDHFGNWILLTGNQKLLYPSAIYGLIETLHYMSQVARILQQKSLYNKQIMLQILSLKAQQISKIGQVILNIYNIIKSKQVSSYDILSDYLLVNMKGIFSWELQWIDKFDLTNEENQMFKNQLKQIQDSKITCLREQLQMDHQKQYVQEKKRIAMEMTKTRASKFLTFYAQKAKKADFLSQIIYEIDSNYEISPILQELLRCQQFHHKTFYFYDNTEFYQTVLYEIIQMRNHIKLDHYYTLPKLHQKFGFFTTKALSFGDILSQLSKLSANQMKVEELLMFFRTQLRLKRNVFRGELHWLTYKGFVENGKQKSFKDFVEQQGSQIFSLSQQPLEYFITNIKDFIRRVSLFEQQIEKFKYYEDLLGKMNFSPIKIKNLDSYLNILTNPQLEQLTKVLHYFNPVTRILKNENPSQRLFTDLRKTIQANNKIKLQEISRDTLLLQEKQKLGQDLFYHKSFGFELCYDDCFNLFVQGSKKSYLHFGNETIKILINRDKQTITKHFDQILAEQQKNIHLALSFYRHLLILSLLLAKDEIIDQDDEEIIQELIENLSYPGNVMKQLQSIKDIFQIGNQNEKQNSKIYVLLKIKKFLHRLVKLTSSNDDIESLIVYNNNRAIQNICLIAKLSTYTQKKILQKIQYVHQDITIKDITKNKKKQKQLDLLNNKFSGYFLTLMKKHLNQFQTANKLMICENQGEIDQKSVSFGLSFSTLEQAMYQVQALLLHKVLTLNKFQSNLFKNKQDLTLFDTLSGYKIKQSQQSNQPNTRDIMRRNDRKVMKKGIFSPVRSPQTSQHNIMQNIQNRVGIEMIKQSMGLRKVISKLQLEQKKMRDQISWQTSKLQHNVINKIHAFIAESNIDQQQSYINFKYTVNLQTIKGMQNVIKEQTQLAYKATMTDQKNIFKRQQHDNDDIEEKQLKEQYKRKFDKKNNKNNTRKDSNDFFITNPDEKNQQQDQPSSILGSQNSRMLNTNIQSIFNHLKKIKVFAAWKKINRNMDIADNQWKNFNKNVANILHNQQNLKRIQIINQKRGECFKQNILCSLLKEENKILSERIKMRKMESLNKTLQNYRMKLIGSNNEEERNE